MKRKFTIPIYEAKLWIVVAKGIAEARIDMNSVFGVGDTSDCDALCTHRKNNFGLFFEESEIDIGMVAHEVFHLTHRILETCGTNFDPTHHEHAAYLHEYLTKLVLKTLGFRVSKR